MLSSVTVTYQDTFKLIAKICNDFLKLKPRWINFKDELISECHLTFLKCYKSYKESSSCKYATWLSQKVWWGLLSWERRRIERNKLMSIKLKDPDYLINIEDTPSILDNLQEKVSPDAEEIIYLTLQPPPDIRLYAKSKKPKILRRAIFNFLKDLGWASSRILESFKEIGDILR